MTSEKILEIARRYGNHDLSDVDWYFYNPDLIAFAKAIIEAERESSDEPYAWVAIHDHHGFDALYFDRQEAIDDGHSFVVPLYRHPQPNARLKDEEILDAVNSADFKSMVTADDYIYVIARAIEQKIWEKAE